MKEHQIVPIREILKNIILEELRRVFLLQQRKRQ